MLSLLTIPREVRDIIIKLVLFSGNQPAPDTYNYVSVPARTRILDVYYLCWIPSKGVLYQSETITPAATPLLLTNHQLCAETRKVLSTQRGDRYTLDVMFVHERELWPTWTSIPAFARRIDTLDVTFRVVGGHDKTGGGYTEHMT